MNRRSIRKFKGLPVKQDKINELLEAARLAPSSSNRQPWRFRVLFDSPAKEFVADASPQVFVRQAPVIILCYADLRCWLPEYARQSRKELGQSRAVDEKDMEMNLSVLGGNPWHTKADDLERYLPNAFLDVGIAIEHMALRAVELGLGTCWCRLVDEERLKEFFKLPSYYKFVSMLLVGYPDQNPSQRPRKHLNDLLIEYYEDRE